MAGPSDKTQTTVLRCAVFLSLYAVFILAVTVLDANISALNKSLFGFPFNHAIESWVFIYVTSRALWKWTSARVWIGTEAKFLPSNKAGDE